MINTLVKRFDSLELWRKIFVSVSVFMIAVVALFTMIIGFSGMDNHFFALAVSFLHGHLYFVPRPSVTSVSDMVMFKGNYFWPLGPFPAILIVPLAMLGQVMRVSAVHSQALLDVILSAGIIYLIISICKSFGYRTFDAWFFAFAFIAGTGLMHLVITSYSWYYAQVVSVFFTFVALREYFYKKRYWIIGCTLACVVATRVTAGFGALFFIVEILLHHEPAREKIKKIGMILIPIFAACCLLALYNFFRFGSFLEQGYSMQMVNLASISKARAYGLFNIVHIPGNLFYAFLRGPLPYFKDGVSHVLKFPYIYPDLWGMGIFFTSPYLLTLFFIPYSKAVIRNLLITSCFIALPIFMYYGIGYIQFGYRYAFDFIPYLFLIFIIGYKEMRQSLSWRMILLFLISAGFNFYMIMTMFAFKY